jgi:hypothetical protein
MSKASPAPMNDQVPESLRYERKFAVRDYSAPEIAQMLKFHPACFREIFHERRVNNIYFDTLAMDHYHTNVDGEMERLKVRVRWYGDTFGAVEKPVLEFKIKKGLLGNKIVYPLKSFTLDQDFDKDQLESAMAVLPKEVLNHLRGLRPTILNTYLRNYYLSADGIFRITIDRSLEYYGIHYGGMNTFLNKRSDRSTAVVELKYDQAHEKEAKETGTDLPFMLTKNSKYLQGVESILF